MFPDGCDQCFLKNNIEALKSHFSDILSVKGAKPDDVVFILNQSGNIRCQDALEAGSFLGQNFPGINVMFDDDFEGMENKVVVNITNGSIGTSPSIIPLSLTRANNHLVVFSEDFRDIFKDAVAKSLVKKSKYNLPSATQTPDPGGAPAELSTGLKEASSVLASLARRMLLESVAALAEEWGVRDLYGELVAQETTRARMVEALVQGHFAANPSTTVAEFVDTLDKVNMADVALSIFADNNCLSAGIQTT
jgi:hypothetical protein